MVDEKADEFALRTGITKEDMALLGRVPLFAGISSPQLRSLLRSSSIRRYPAATTLFLEGEAASRFFVTMDGWTKLSRQCGDGQEIVVTVVSPGESFAEAAIFDSSTFPVNATTITDSRFLVVNADSMLTAVRDNVELAFNMLASMSRFLRGNITLLQKISAMSSTERLADFLLSLVNEQTGPATIHLPMDKALIAGRLGMQPETFSRALAKLKPLGVTSKGHDVQIADVTKLQKLIAHNS